MYDRNAVNPDRRWGWTAKARHMTRGRGRGVGARGDLALGVWKTWITRRPRSLLTANDRSPAIGGERCRTSYDRPWRVAPRRRGRCRPIRAPIGQTPSRGPVPGARGRTVSFGNGWMSNRIFMCFPYIGINTRGFVKRSGIDRRYHYPYQNTTDGTETGQIPSVDGCIGHSVSEPLFSSSGYERMRAGVAQLAERFLRKE